MSCNKMGIFKLNLFCCCCDLEMGAKIVGFLHTACAIMLVSYTSYLAVDARDQIGTVSDVDSTYSQVYRYMCVVAGMGSVHIVLGLVLLVGAYARKTFLLLAWTTIMTVLYVAAIFFISYVTILHGVTLTSYHLFIAFLEGAFFFIFTGHCILCVGNFYLKLKKDQEMYQNPNIMQY